MSRIKGGRPRDDRVTAAILTAARDLFVGGGLGAVTMDGVATRAGVGRSTVYRRWSTPDEIVLAALLQVRESGEAGAEDWAAWSLDAVLDAFAARAAQALLDPGARALLRQLVALPPDHPVALAHRETVLVPRRTEFARVLRAAQLEGALGPGVDVDLVQEQLEGALLHRTLLVEPFDSEADALTWVERLIGALGLRGPGRTGARPSADCQTADHDLDAG